MRAVTKKGMPSFLTNACTRFAIGHLTKMSTLKSGFSRKNSLQTVQNLLFYIRIFPRFDLVEIHRVYPCFTVLNIDFGSKPLFKTELLNLGIFVPSF